MLIQIIFWTQSTFGPKILVATIFGSKKFVLDHLVLATISPASDLSDPLWRQGKPKNATWSKNIRTLAFIFKGFPKKNTLFDIKTA